MGSGGVFTASSGDCIFKPIDVKLQVNILCVVDCGALGFKA